MLATDLMKEVDLGEGDKYRVVMCSAREQRAVMFKLGRYGLEPALREISLASVAPGAAYMVALRIMSGMVARLPEDEFNYIMDTMLINVTRISDGKKITIDDFIGDMQRYIRLGILALGVNFADFSQLLTLFQKSTELEGGADQETNHEETSTQESIGSSTGPA